jgi:Zn finger protein HypA/HybF involved in hydrogenase expression
VHELSVALEVCRIAEERLGTSRAHCLRTITLEIGQDAGLEPANLEFCLETLLAQPPFGQARPELRLVPGNDLRMPHLEVEEDEPDP